MGRGRRSGTGCGGQKRQRGEEAWNRLANHLLAPLEGIAGKVEAAAGL
jgi:hypothetical protein